MSVTISFADLEQRVVECDGEATPMATLESDFKNRCDQLQKRIRQGGLHEDELQHLYEQATRIKHIALFMKAIYEAQECTSKETQCETLRLCDEFASRPSPQKDESVVASQDTTLSNRTQDSLHSKVLRQWFLDNLSDPFPDRQTKEMLVWRTNALFGTASPERKSKISLSSQPIDIQQCALWFINSRRRSQWTSLFRRFAHSDKQTLKKLLDTLLAEEDVARPGRNIALEAILEQDAKGTKCKPNDLVKRVEDCREVFSALMEWLRQKPKQKVGDWMDEVIAEAKMELKEEKKALQEERNRVTISEGEGEGLYGRKQHKRKSTNDECLEDAEESENRRRSGRIVKRRFDLRDEQQIPSTSASHGTPRSTSSLAYLGDASSSSSSWSSSASSRRVPSLFESNDSHLRSVSAASSISSLASYDAFHQVPGSPTLRILKNNQAQHTDQSNLQPLQSQGWEETRMSDPSSFQHSHTWPTEAQTNSGILSGAELAKPVEIPVRKNAKILFPTGYYQA